MTPSCTDTIEDPQPEESNANYSLTGFPLHFFHSQKFRGFNINPWISEAEFGEIVEKTGANILRVSFTGGAKLMSKTPSNGTGSTAEYEFNDDAFEALDHILNWAKNHNIKIIIDPHTAPGFESDFTTSATDAFWHDTEWHNHLISLWEKIITEVSIPAYQDVIAGYDLLNEPEIPDPLLCQYGNQWNTLVATLVNTIRSKETQFHHPIIIQPAGVAIGLNCNGGGGTPQILSRWRALKLLCLPDDGNLVVSSHFYDPLFFTHQGVALNIPTGFRYPGNIPNFPNVLYAPPTEYWDQNRMDAELNYLRIFSAQHPNVPILIGEFSIARAAGCDGDVFLNHFLKMVEYEGWNWTYHAWDRQEPNLPAPWHPGYSYTSPLSNNAPNTESLETAPRINLLRQYMYKNLNNFPPTNQMIYGLYRLSHANGEQLLTHNLSEVSTAVFDHGYVIDGVFGRVAKDNNSNVVTVHKLRKPNSGNRLFTTSETEKNTAINTYGYIDEGIGFYASSTNINNSYIPVYRLQKGAFHRYAMSVAEKDYLSTSLGGNWVVELNGLPAFYLQPSQMY